MDFSPSGFFIKNINFLFLAVGAGEFFYPVTKVLMTLKQFE